MDALPNPLPSNSSPELRSVAAGSEIVLPALSHFHKHFSFLHGGLGEGCVPGRGVEGVDNSSVHWDSPQRHQTSFSLAGGLVARHYSAESATSETPGVEDAAGSTHRSVSKT
jgi:hypothetical protein